MNALAIAISIVLLPGLVASVICDKITVHSPRWDAFKYSIYSFLFGVLSYGLLQALNIIYLFGLALLCSVHEANQYKLGIWSIIQQANPKVPLLEVGLATLLAPVIAFIASAIVNYKIINKIAQRLGISQKYGDENLFSYFLNSRDVTKI